jgi:hypothetical protein
MLCITLTAAALVAAGAAVAQEAPEGNPGRDQRQAECTTRSPAGAGNVRAEQPIFNIVFPVVFACVACSAEEMFESSSVSAP